MKVSVVNHDDGLCAVYVDGNFTGEDMRDPHFEYIFTEIKKYVDQHLTSASFDWEVINTAMDISNGWPKTVDMVIPLP